ncbi:hypothetical protein D3C78_1426470 [compost metagenome]
MQAAFAERRLLGQFGEGEAEQVADLQQPLEAEAAAGEQALDAGFGEIEGDGQVAVGHAARLELALEGGQQLVEFAHGKSRIFRYFAGQSTRLFPQ